MTTYIIDKELLDRCMGMLQLFGAESLKNELQTKITNQNRIAELLKKDLQIEIEDQDRIREEMRKERDNDFYRWYVEEDVFDDSSYVVGYLVMEKLLEVLSKSIEAMQADKSVEPYADAYVRRMFRIEGAQVLYRELAKWCGKDK